MLIKRLMGVVLASLFLQTQAFAETVLITGSNKGIGLAFAQAYAEKGWTVIATARKPEKAEALQALKEKYPDTVVIEQLDVTDEARIEDLAALYQETPIDILLNNAGISGLMKDEAFGNIDYDLFNKEIAVNLYGPLRMAEAFLPHVKASQQKKIIAVSSSMGSITGAMGWMYAYRSSKAALNMAYRNLSQELKKDGVIVGLMNPGQTRTDLMKEVPGELRPPSDAAADIIRNIDALTIETTGSFVQYDGTPLPW